MSLVPVPEVREMVQAAKRFVAGDIHFSNMVGPTQSCVWWCRVHGSHPAIQSLAFDWDEMANRVWNEYGTFAVAMPVEEYRQRVAEDLGCRVSPNKSLHPTAATASVMESQAGGG